MKARLFEVKDHATRMDAVVVKFSREEAKKLGWDTDNLTLLCEIGNRAYCAISDFNFPDYDIPARTGELKRNGTTIKLAEWANKVKPEQFDKEPDLVDLIKFKSKYIPSQE
jgi:hypothetical protein